LKFPLTPSLYPGPWPGRQAYWGEETRIVREEFSAYKSFKARQGFLGVRF